jgi:hypothetical protein
MQLAHRPLPPPDLLDSIGGRSVPDHAAADWIRRTFIHLHGPLANEEHAHLTYAHIGVVWSTVPFKKQQRQVAGMTEDPANLKGNRWTVARQVQQLEEWFQTFPDFVITFDATIAAELDDASWCALVEHELYHCAQALDEFDMPKFRRDGSPVFAIRGHDVEEFVGVVARYGAAAATAGVGELVRAAQRPPSVAPARIAAACGTCLKKVA